eukprot:scaffold4437_cov391-Prasinococcus_capsulatus_cf.AAC.11
MAANDGHVALATASEAAVLGRFIELSCRFGLLGAALDADEGVACVCSSARRQLGGGRTTAWQCCGGMQSTTAVGNLVHMFIGSPSVAVRLGIMRTNDARHPRLMVCTTTRRPPCESPTGVQNVPDSAALSLRLVQRWARNLSRPGG